MSLSRAISIAKSYERRFQLFEHQYELLSRLLAGTPLAEDMLVLKESVEQAW